MSQVLIIEDELATAEPVKQALELNGISADIAKDGAEGIQKFEQGDYELVLLDLRLPGMQGEEVLVKLRKIDPFIDVIIYTNYSEFADIKKLANIGIEGYINKGPSADLGELVDAIKKKLAPLDNDTFVKLLESIE